MNDEQATSVDERTAVPRGQSGRTRTSRSLRLVSVAAAVVLGASACTFSETGAAAVVGDRRISTGELQRALTGLREGNPQFAEVPQLDRLVLFDLIAEPFLLQAAEAEGLGVAESEAQAALPETPQAAPEAVRVLRAQLALNRLNEAQRAEALEGVGTALREAGVEVSPRFGRFDTQTLSIVDQVPNWLVPTATPSATAPAAPADPGAEQPPAEQPPAEAPAEPAPTPEPTATP